MTSLPSDSSGDESLLDEIVGFLKRFVVFPRDSQPVALALWVIHTYAFTAADATAYLLITSPEKRSGKSRRLEVLELLTARAWRVSGVSEAVLFRKIEKDVPTLLLDELDAIFGTYAEKTEGIRGAIDAGSRRGAYVSRCAGPNHEVKDFAVFCPKCLAGIDSGRLPDTIRDRSIPIRMERKVDEPVERFRYRRVAAEAESLVGRIEEWAGERVEGLRDSYPEIPDELNDRAADGWEPLLAIADALDGDCPARAHGAALELSTEIDVEEDSFGIQLLADLKLVYENPDLGVNLKSDLLCSALAEMEDRPWGAGARVVKPGFNPRDLAKLLRRYGITPKTIRLGGATAKGYQRAQFTAAWARYVPTRPETDEVDLDEEG